VPNAFERYLKSGSGHVFSRKHFVSGPHLRVVAILLFTRKNLSREERSKVPKEIRLRQRLRLTAIQAAVRRELMHTIHAKPAVRIFVAMLVTATIIGLSSLAMHASTQNQNSLAPSLRSIQTDKATSFYAGPQASRTWFVECALPGTSESKAATENLKVITAAL